jgi:hypothetical protein
MILENGDLRNAHLCHSCPSIPFKRKTHESQKSSIHARHTSQMPNKQTLSVLGLNVFFGPLSISYDAWMMSHIKVKKVFCG